jgi:hypothetical protein
MTAAEWSLLRKRPIPLYYFVSRLPILESAHRVGCSLFEARAGAPMGEA